MNFQECLTQEAMVMTNIFNHTLCFTQTEISFCSSWMFLTCSIKENITICEIVFSCRPDYQLIAPDWCSCTFECFIFKSNIVTEILNIPSGIVLKWIHHVYIDDTSTLIQAKAWCHQATCYCRNQCWQRPMETYGITQLQWLKHWNPNI